jgi:SAM-dependent methyltransferase
MDTITARTQPVTLAADPPGADPEVVFRLASGFMASKFLFAASELGLFEALAEGPTDLDGLAARTGLTRRCARIAADAMVALGLLSGDGGTYANTPTSAAFLAGATPADMRPLLRFWNKISLPQWLDLDGTLGRGHPDHQIYDLEPELVPIMSAGIDAATAGAAAAFAASAAVAPRSRLLDVGGGTGSWSIALARHDATVRAAVLELPEVAAVARERVATAGLADRVEVVDGDVQAGGVPRGYDCYLVANVVHYWGPDRNRALLETIRQAAEPGDLLHMADFWTDATHTSPLPAALMAGEFALHLDEGDVYSVEECTAWLVETGWRLRAHRPLAGPISLVTAEAV